MRSEVMARAPEVGLTQHVIRRSWLKAPSFGLEYGFDRYPLLRGQQSGSRDGKAIAPLLGTITGYDGGTTDLHLGPMTFALAYCDHVVIYRFAPRGQYLTDCEITWLVNESAVEGKDYALADLDLALGRHYGRRQDDHRAQPGGRRLAVLRARAALGVDGIVYPGVPRLVRRGHAPRDRRRFARPAAGR